MNPFPQWSNQRVECVSEECPLWSCLQLHRGQHSPRVVPSHHMFHWVSLKHLASSSLLFSPLHTPFCPSRHFSRHPLWDFCKSISEKCFKEWDSSSETLRDSSLLYLINSVSVMMLFFYLKWTWCIYLQSVWSLWICLFVLWKQLIQLLKIHILKLHALPPSKQAMFSHRCSSSLLRTTIWLLKLSFTFLILKLSDYSQVYVTILEVLSLVSEFLDSTVNGKACLILLYLLLIFKVHMAWSISHLNASIRPHSGQKSHFSFF